MTSLEQRLPPLATLVPFEAAVRHRNFTRAADELHLSQATVSRRIRQLEANLGLSLFDRHRYDVTPTAEATALAASVRQALGELSSSAERLRLRAADAGSLTIFSDLSLSSTLVAPLLGDYQRRHPDLKIRVLSSFEPIETTNDDFDIGLQYGRSAPTPYDVEIIATEAVFPVCSPSFAEQVSSDALPQSLTTLPLLHVAYADDTWTSWSDFFAFLGIDETPTAHLTFTSYVVCLDVAEQGEGIALGWERTVQPRLDAGSLVRLDDLSMPNAGVINAYVPKRSTTNPHTARFLKVLKGAAGG